MVPTLGRTADVRGGPRVDGALGVLGQGVLTGPVKVVHLILHEAADLLVLKAAGVICGGQREGAAAFQTPSPDCLGAHRSAVSPLRLSIKPGADGQLLTSAGGWKGRHHRNHRNHRMG